jgi:hypothetical protein
MVAILQRKNRRMINGFVLITISAALALSRAVNLVPPNLSSFEKTVTVVLAIAGVSLVLHGATKG